MYEKRLRDAYTNTLLIKCDRARLKFYFNRIQHTRMVQNIGRVQKFQLLTCALLVQTWA